MQPLKRKISFILYNYEKLKTGQRTGDSPTVYVTNRRNYEPMGYVDIPLGLRLVDGLLNYFKIDNQGIDKFIELYFFKHRSFTYIVDELHISERTAFYWRLQVLDKAELIAAMINFK